VNPRKFAKRDDMNDDCDGGIPVSPRVIVAHRGVHSAGVLESAFNAQARNLEKVIESMPQLVCAFGLDGRVKYSNSRWRDTFGVSVGEAAEEAILSHLEVDDRQEWLTAWHQALTAGVSYRVEHRVTAPCCGKSRWHVEHGVVVGDGTAGSKRLLITVLQPDERRNVEAELRSLLARKEEFMSIVLHELRNPLAPIANALTLLQRHSADPSVVMRAHGVLTRQIHQVTRLVDDLFNSSRIQQGAIEIRPSVVDIADVVLVAVEAVQPLVDSRRHQLRVSAGKGMFLVHADAARLAQVLTNLLINAAKYTEPGGCISVGAERLDGEVCLHVRDNGIGIAPEQLERVFELYARGTAEPRERMDGLGIGLAVARRLVELQGGSIAIRSEGPGCGSEFTIRITRSF
jgi:signal transduction histidine kinase